MKNHINLSTILLCLVLMVFASCSNKDKSEKEKTNYDFTGDKLVITDKIMYDVQIVNDSIGSRTKECPDWFWENLPSPDAENFVKNLLEDAASGKLKTYYYDMASDYESFPLIPRDSLSAFMKDIMTFEFYSLDTTSAELKPVIINIPLDYRNVKELRFLEEWFVADGRFYKRVVAVAPFFIIEYPGMDPVKQIYFWIMLDDKVAKK